LAAAFPSGDYFVEGSAQTRQGRTNYTQLNGPAAAQVNVINALAEVHTQADLAAGKLRVAASIQPVGSDALAFGHAAYADTIEFSTPDGFNCPIGLYLTGGFALNNPSTPDAWQQLAGRLTLYVWNSPSGLTPQNADILSSSAIIAQNILFRPGQPLPQISASITVPPGTSDFDVYARFEAGGPGVGTDGSFLADFGNSANFYIDSPTPFISRSGVLLTATTEQSALVLTILDTGTNALKVCWPAPASGWVLQENSALGTTNWVNSLLTPVIEDTNKCVTIGPPTGSHFYRLLKP
jgi:hypothetical protein